jgi:hypothetical protein
LPARERAARCAGAAAGVGAAGAVSLALMFGVETPRGGPYVFGATNDVLGVAFDVLAIPVFAELSADLPDGPVRRLLAPAVLAASGTAAASGALLVARVLPFAPSTAVSVAGMEVQAAWLLLAGRQLRDAGAPRDVGALGAAIGAGMLGGALVAGLGLLFPRTSAGRRVLFYAGAAPGALAWALWPLWFHRVARYLRST